MSRSKLPAATFSFVCFVFAFVLSIIALPAWMDFWRPAWLILFLLSWLMAMPNNIGMLPAFLCGLVLDVLLGDTFGINALCMSIALLICHFQYLRIRSYTQLQQGWFVAVLVVIYQTIYLMLQALLGSDISLMMLIGPSISSFVVWMLLTDPLFKLQRRYGVA